MKKLFALVLAAAMVLSMASVAFAAGDHYLLAVNDEALYIMDDHNLCPVMADDMGVYNSKFGDTIYVPVFGVKFIEESTLSEPGDESPRPEIDVMSFDEIIKNFKIKAKWDKNGDLIESVKFEKVLIDRLEAPYLPAPSTVKKITTVLAIETKEMPEEVEASDIIGSIEIDPKSKALVYFGSDRSSLSPELLGKERALDVAFTLDVKPADINKTEDDDLVYDFEGHEDEEHEIELFAGMGRFVVNTYGQNKLVVNTDVKFNEGIENADPDVNYAYFNSNEPSFNRIGDLYLTANEDDVLYKVNKDKSLTKLNAKYDEDEEAFALRTRVIGSYVIAEGELNENALIANVEKPAAPVAPVVPANPSTGAAC